MNNEASDSQGETSSAVDVVDRNRQAWDSLVQNQNRWTLPVTTSQIEEARRGKFEVVLTPKRPVPQEWFPESLKGQKILCLAGAGGQQSPIFAAAGAHVTVFDNSPMQLEQDRLVAERDGLELQLEQGDMADLSRFSDESFDLVFHPCSNTFVPDVRVVYREAARVLKAGGTMLSGFCNPLRWMFEDERHENGQVNIMYRIPYSDVNSLSKTDYEKIVVQRGSPLEFSHTLENQIDGQISAGLVLTGFFEDRYAPEDGDVLSEYISTFIATRSVKIRQPI